MLSQNHLGDGWQSVARVMLWEIGLFVWVRDTLAHDVQAVQTGKEATGLMSICPNKGGCVVSMRIRSTTLVFIGTHLAAHMHQCAVRNSNVSNPHVPSCQLRSHRGTDRWRRFWRKSALVTRT